MTTMVTCRECGRLSPNVARGLCKRCYNRAYRTGILDLYPTTRRIEVTRPRKRRCSEDIINDLVYTLTDLQLDDIGVLVADLGYEGNEFALAKLLYRQAQRIDAYGRRKKAGQA